MKWIISWPLLFALFGCNEIITSVNTWWDWSFWKVIYMYIHYYWWCEVFMLYNVDNSATTECNVSHFLCFLVYMMPNDSVCFVKWAVLSMTYLWYIMSSIMIYELLRFLNRKFLLFVYCCVIVLYIYSLCVCVCVCSRKCGNYCHFLMFGWRITIWLFTNNHT